MSRKRIMTLFTFDSSQLNLQGAVFRFDLVQTITDIPLFFTQQIFWHFHHFATHEITFYSIIVRDKIMRLFLFDQLQFRLPKTVFKFDLAQSTRKLSLFLFKKYSGAATIFGIYLHFTLGKVMRLFIFD
jgi:hypothetical protein